MSRPQGPAVCVVEDDPGIAEFVSTVMRMEGYRVERAATGEDALARIGKQPPDLVLLDLKLPRMDGWAVLKAIREDPALDGVRIIVLTAFSEPEILIRARDMGAQAVLGKAIGASALAKGVAGVMQSYGPKQESDSRSG